MSTYIRCLLVNCHFIAKKLFYLTTEILKKQATFLPINGFMTQKKLWIEGQIVLINPKYLNYEVKESALKNSMRLYKLYNPKNVKESTLNLFYKDERKWEVALDEAGYFRVTLDLTEYTDFDPKQIRYFLGENTTEVYRPKYSEDNIFPVPDEEKIVISDIDDTILVSHATNKWKKFLTLLRYGALQRQQVEAMNEFFQHIDKHYGFIYLSNSEMNLYPLIKNFLYKHKFPKGPLFLREHMSIAQVFSGRYRYFQTKHHKLYTLELLMRSFPNKKFILVGDSGQKDAEIYFTIAKEFRDQIEKVYIREITGERRRKKLLKIQEELGEIGIDFILFHSGKNLLPA